MHEELFIEFHTRWFYLPAIITVAFLFSYLGVHECYKKIRSFYAVLDDEQKTVYMEIRKEREKTYWSALLQGCFVAILYILMTTFTCGKSKAIYHLLSDIFCIILTTTYFVYLLKEKKKVMLIDGDLDDAQEKKWIDIYRCMQRSFWSYFLIGLLFSGFVFSLLDILTPPIRVCVHHHHNKKQNINNKKQNINKKNQ